LWLSLAAALPLAGCGTRGFSLEDAVPGAATLAPDRTLLTHSVSQQQPAISADPAEISDRETIRNAVTSAIVDEVGSDGIGWANAGTGSRGAIRQIDERQETSRLCRRFLATRESYQGVHLYRGETCLGAARIWTMTAFDRVE
jgi:hypothetical protein